MEIVIFIFGKPESTTVCSVYIAALCLDVNLKNIIELIRENRFDVYPEGEAEPLACIPTISDLPPPGFRCNTDIVSTMMDNRSIS